MKSVGSFLFHYYTETFGGVEREEKRGGEERGEEEKRGERGERGRVELLREMAQRFAGVCERGSSHFLMFLIALLNIFFCYVFS